jgi:hypothetical protein
MSMRCIEDRPAQERVRQRERERDREREGQRDKETAGKRGEEAITDSHIFDTNKI